VAASHENADHSQSLLKQSNMESAIATLQAWQCWLNSSSVAVLWLAASGYTNYHCHLTM